MVRYSGPSSFLLQNAQLFTLTYGAVVTQLVQDYEDVVLVNKQLDQMYVYVRARACPCVAVCVYGSLLAVLGATTLESA